MWLWEIRNTKLKIQTKINTFYSLNNINSFQTVKLFIILTADLCLKSTIVLRSFLPMFLKLPFWSFPMEPTPFWGLWVVCLHRVSENNSKIRVVQCCIIYKTNTKSILLTCNLLRNSSRSFLFSGLKKWPAGTPSTLISLKIKAPLGIWWGCLDIPPKVRHYIII